MEYPTYKNLWRVQKREFPGSILIPKEELAIKLLAQPLNKTETLALFRWFVVCIANTQEAPNAFFYRTAGGSIGHRLTLEPSGYQSGCPLTWAQLTGEQMENNHGHNSNSTTSNNHSSSYDNSY
jgi:hypothetical protein